MADKEELKAGHQAAVEDEDEKVAGRLKAVKVGGMRVVQHKTPNHERPAADIKDCTGLTQQPNVNTETVSGAPIKENADFTPKAAQVAHTPKPPKYTQSAHQAVHHINQPRK